jgi:hypothetical protein
LFTTLCLSYRIADRGADKPRTTGGQPADKVEDRGQGSATDRRRAAFFTGFRTDIAVPREFGDLAEKDQNKVSNSKKTSRFDTLRGILVNENPQNARASLGR